MFPNLPKPYNSNEKSLENLQPSWSSELEAQNSIILESVCMDGLVVIRGVGWWWFEVRSVRFDDGS
ncbi:hypothetical protein C1H46_003990 [Malus baccata]|uniref:Uncharacterized protein n=1 Tax=Malus baccata TaxID=106549 RepID=A0A540NIG8_MALBA|nr:hypothetical protein C1H46_003990 [Malus baccata]